MIDEDDEEDENYQVDFDDDDEDEDLPKEQNKPPGGLTRVPGSSNIQKLGDEDDSDSDSDKFNDINDLK